MIFVTLSIMVTVFAINIHHRSSSTHDAMAPWVRKIFLHKLPKVLCMRSHADRYFAQAGTGGAGSPGAPRNTLEAALDSIRYITRHVRKENDVREVCDTWCLRMLVRLQGRGAGGSGRGWGCGLLPAESLASSPAGASPGLASQVPQLLLPCRGVTIPPWSCGVAFTYLPCV